MFSNGDFSTGLWPWGCNYATYDNPSQAAIWPNYGWVDYNWIFPNGGHASAFARTESYDRSHIAGCPVFGQWLYMIPGVYKIAYDIALDGYGDTIPNTALVGGVIMRPLCSGPYCITYSANAQTEIQDKDVISPSMLLYRITDTITFDQYPTIHDNLLINGGFELTGGWTGTWQPWPGGLQSSVARITYWMGNVYQQFSWPGGTMWASAFSVSWGSHTIQIKKVATGEIRYLCNHCTHSNGEESTLLWVDAAAGTYEILLSSDNEANFDSVWVSDGPPDVYPIHYFVGIQNQHVQKPWWMLRVPDENVDEISVLYLDNLYLCYDSSVPSPLSPISVTPSGGGKMLP